MDLEALMRKDSHSCCVPECGKVIHPRHRFPNPKLRLPRFLARKDAVQNPKHLELSREEIFKRSYVCVSHFTMDDFKPGTSHKLKDTAIPHRNLNTTSTSTSSPSSIDVSGGPSPSQSLVKPSLITPSKEYTA